MDVFCPAVDMNYTYNTSPGTLSPGTERNKESDVSTQSGSPSVLTTALIVFGVLLVCAVGGGLFLAKVLRKRTNIPDPPEYCDVYPPRSSYDSVHSYAYVDSRRSSIPIYSYIDVRPDSNNATGYSYVSVQ
jgi:hypothetical protein